jgi:TRAP-type C4-dicarboxylate transport system permease small subunit
VPLRAARLMEAAADIIGFLVCLVLVRYGLDMVVASARLNALTIKNLVFPEWWLLAPLPVIFILLAVEFVFRFHRLLASGGARRAEATSVG